MITISTAWNAKKYTNPGDGEKLRKIICYVLEIMGTMLLIRI